MACRIVDLSGIGMLTREFEASDELYLLKVGDQRILFRVDGLIVKVSDALFDFLSSDLECEERFGRIVDLYGRDVAESCVESIRALGERGVLRMPMESASLPDAQKVQPSGILIMVTQTCNLACTYCYAGGGTYGSPTKLMSGETAESAIDMMLRRAPDRKHFTVTFFGGEPLLNFKLIKKVVAYCEHFKRPETTFAFTMTTNGTVLNDEILAFLKEKRFTLMVSFDGSMQDSSRPFRNGRGTSELVSRNIRRLTEAGLPIQLRATLIRGMVNQESVEEIVQYGRALGCQFVVMSPVDSTKNGSFSANEELMLESEDVGRLAALYRQAADDNLETARQGRRREVIFDPYVNAARAFAQGRALGFGRCGACFGMAAVSTEGTIYPCHRFVGMDEYGIGSLEKGVDAERVAEFFDGIDESYKEKCSTCWARLICGGICYYHTADGHGAFTVPDDADCEAYRAGIKYAIGYLLRIRALPDGQAKQYFENVRRL